jgi:hypothetical protein
MANPETTAKAIYCPRRQQHAAVCETPNACAGGADCRLGPDLNAHMNDRPSVSNTTDLTDLVTAMLKVDAVHDPSEANALLSAGAQEIKRLRAAGRKIARPWIDGGLTVKEWLDAVDALMPSKKRWPL